MQKLRRKPMLSKAMYISSVRDLSAMWDGHYLVQTLPIVGSKLELVALNDEKLESYNILNQKILGDGCAGLRA
ncbi:hypothetical protein ACFQT0_17940 [Hymenobacter humi]|uniref:Uncharacterized protein n=1 Tax=Hymenobacter humi TaxID=1411620 RepID=A0ABW2U6C0_9BACT